MGCDIHFYVEKLIDGVWQSADTVNTDDDGRPDVSYRDQLYSGRSYNLFAILADVRNGRGFAGCKTGAGFNPISSPRGVPHDASDVYARIAKDSGSDGHSHSWLGLRELLDYDWTQTTRLQGLVNLSTWIDWSSYDRQRGNGPDTWCGAQFSDERELSAAGMDALLDEYKALTDREQKEPFLKKHARVFGLAEWGVTYARAAGSFMTDTIPRLLRVAGGSRGIDSVRVCFFFDN